MATQLVLTDVTTTENLNDGTNYEVLVNWVPAVAQREDMRTQENIRIRVFSTSATDTVSKLNDIKTLLVQAERWATGEAVDAVKIQYAPDGTTLGSPAEAIVYSGNIQLEADWAQQLTVKDVWIQLSVVRGDWLGARSTNTLDEGEGSAEVPNPQSIAFAAGDYNSPVDLAIDLEGTGVDPTIDIYFKDAFVLFSYESDRMSVKEADGMTATNWTAFNDSANKPFDGTNVLRYTPVATTESESGTLSLTVIDDDVLSLSIFANVRSANQAFLLRAGIIPNDDTPFYSWTRKNLIPVADFTEPRWVYLGTASIGGTLDGTRVGPGNLKLAATALSTSGSPLLDIDSIAVIASDAGGATRVVSLLEVPSDPNYFSLVPVTFNVQGNVLPSNGLSQVTPSVVFEYDDDVGTGFKYALPYMGSARLVTRGAGGGTVALLVNGQNGAASAYWRPVDDTGDVLKMSGTVVHRPVYMVVP